MNEIWVSYQGKLFVERKSVKKNVLGLWDCKMIQF